VVGGVCVVRLGTRENNVEGKSKEPAERVVFVVRAQGVVPQRPVRRITSPASSLMQPFQDPTRFDPFRSHCTRLAPEFAIDRQDRSFGTGGAGAETAILRGDAVTVAAALCWGVVVCVKPQSNLAPRLMGRRAPG